MYKEKQKPQIVKLTPKEAEKMLSINNFPGQRRLNPEKAKMYADNMRDGRQRRVEISTVHVTENDTDYLMNGQHNCSAVVATGVPCEAVIVCYECDTMEDAWRLFTTFDVSGNRTDQQFILSRKGMFKDECLRDLTPRLLLLCGSALYSLGNGTTPTFHKVVLCDKTVKCDLIEKHSDDVLFVNRFKCHKHLMRSGVVCAMIATYRKNKKEADKFWNKVGSGEMLEHGEPAKKLRDMLLKTSFGGNCKGGIGFISACFVISVAWWNSYRTGDNREHVQITAFKTFPQVKA